MSAQDLSPSRAMTTYVLSQHNNTWYIHQYGEDVSMLASNIPSEEEALQIALQNARQKRPSEVIRIAFTGENRVVASFASEEGD